MAIEFGVRLFIIWPIGKQCSLGAGLEAKGGHSSWQGDEFASWRDNAKFGKDHAGGEE